MTINPEPTEEPSSTDDLDVVDHEPWDRVDGEPSNAYAAFRIFRDLPPTHRKVQTAAEQAGLSPSRGRHLAQDWAWRERAEAWDDACHRIEDHERLEAIRSMHKNHRAAGRLALVKAVEALQNLSAENLGPSDVARLLSLGAKLERDTLVVSVEELQGIHDYEDDDDPWERIARELTTDAVDG